MARKPLAIQGLKPEEAAFLESKPASQQAGNTESLPGLPEHESDPPTPMSRKGLIAITIRLPADLVDWLDVESFQRKRRGQEPWRKQDLVTEALQRYRRSS